jgi:sterol 3beta-glucosyltransferase
MDYSISSILPMSKAKRLSTEEMTRCVVDAVVASGCYAILSKGWSDRGSKKEDKDGDKDKEDKDEKAEKDDKDEADGADGVKYPPEI